MCVLDFDKIVVLAGPFNSEESNLDEAHLERITQEASETVSEYGRILVRLP